MALAGCGRPMFSSGETMRPRFTVFALVMTSLLLLLAARPAQADLTKPKDPVAREHLEQGNRYYRVREFDKAIDEYKAGALIISRHRPSSASPRTASMSSASIVCF